MAARYWKETLALVIGLLAALFFAEVLTRFYFAWSVGPRVLLYGTDWFRNVDPPAAEKRTTITEREYKEATAEWSRKDSVEVHGRALKGYNKFFPNEYKTTKDADTGERIPVTINSHGFRGKEFEVKKAPGVIRVLTMGSSSTFGYYDRDNETYPYYLEQTLNSSCKSGTRFEVINFAIPHAGIANIAAMFFTEGIGLAPDVVTLYEGRNDSTIAKETKGVGDKAYSVLVHRLLLAAFIDQTLVGERVSLTDPSMQLGPQAEQRSRAYFEKLTTILDASQKAGIKLIVASQQATSKSPLPGAVQERLALRGVTYADEAESIRQRMERNENVTAYEFSFLVHQRLMQDLKLWADKHGVPFVDIISALDKDRHYLLSWVHLHPEANRVIAAKYSEAILNQFCAAPK